MFESVSHHTNACIPASRKERCVGPISLPCHACSSPIPGRVSIEAGKPVPRKAEASVRVHVRPMPVALLLRKDRAGCGVLFGAVLQPQSKLLSLRILHSLARETLPNFVADRSRQIHAKIFSIRGFVYLIDVVLKVLQSLLISYPKHDRASPATMKIPACQIDATACCGSTFSAIHSKDEDKNAVLPAARGMALT